MAALLATVRALYWFVTGGLLGVGVLEFPGIGLILLPIGLMLLAFGLFTLRSREALVGILGFGAVPAELLLQSILTTNIPPHVQMFYFGSTIISVAITVVGLVALALAWRPRRADSRALRLR